MMSMTVGVLYCARRIGILLRYRSVCCFVFCPGIKARSVTAAKKNIPVIRVARSSSLRSLAPAWLLTKRKPKNPQ